MRGNLPGAKTATAEATRQTASASGIAWIRRITRRLGAKLIAERLGATATTGATVSEIRHVLVPNRYRILSTLDHRGVLPASYAVPMDTLTQFSRLMLDEVIAEVRPDLDLYQRRTLGTITLAQIKQAMQEQERARAATA